MDHQQPFARALLASNPQHPGTLYLLGLIENRQGRPHAAIDFIQQAIALCPEAPAFQLSLADVRYVQNYFAARNKPAARRSPSIRILPGTGRWRYAIRSPLIGQPESH